MVGLRHLGDVILKFANIYFPNAKPKVFYYLFVIIVRKLRLITK